MWGACRGCKNGLRSAELPLPCARKPFSLDDLDLISYLRSIPDARMRRGVRIPAWYLLLVGVLSILSFRKTLRDLERFVI